MKPFRAAMKEAEEIGFTVINMSVSLVAVIPLLMMGGVVAAVQEFSITLSVAIAVSMVVSLTTTPMMCAYMLRQHEEHGWLYEWNERIFNGIVSIYAWTLARVLRHPAITLMALARNHRSEREPVPLGAQGILPAAGRRRLSGSIQADQDTSFQAMQEACQRIRPRSSRTITPWQRSVDAAAEAAEAAEPLPTRRNSTSV